MLAYLSDHPRQVARRLEQPRFAVVTDDGIDRPLGNLAGGTVERHIEGDGARTEVGQAFDELCMTAAVPR